MVRGKFKSFVLFFDLCYFVVLRIMFKRNEISCDYVPATQEEAESFAKVLETAINRGDKTLLLEAHTDIDMEGVFYTFRGLDVPANIRKATNETRSRFSVLMKDRNATCFKNTKKVRYISCTVKENIALIVFNLDKFNVLDTVHTNLNCTFQLVKRKLDDRIVIAAYGGLTEADN